MTPTQEARALRTLAAALALVENRMGALGHRRDISEDTSDLLALEGSRLAGAAYALELQAEMLDPTPCRTIAQLNAGKCVPVIKEERT